MSAPRKPAPPPSAAVRFRREIEHAEAEGVAREAMTLHLTYGDTGRLKRDATLAVEDLSFAGGVMRYLGVTIAQGDVTESTLTYPEG